MNEDVLAGLALLVSLGAASQIIAWHIKIPSILVLLVVGFLAGPVLNILSPDRLLGDGMFPLVSMGAAIILFEGGLTSRVQDFNDVRAPVLRLVTVGLLLTWILASAFAILLLDLPLSLAALLGAILVVTGPTVIGPLVRHARPQGKVGKILKYEGIVNDPLGALLAVIIFQVIEVELAETALRLVIWGVLKAAILASLFGYLGSVFFIQGRKRGLIPPALSNAVLLTLVLGIYTLAHRIQSESGLLAVTVMGMALASQNDVDVEPNVAFSEHLRTMLISVLFILLVARMEWEDLRQVPLAAFLFVALLIFLVRPIAVLASTIGTSLHFKQRLYLAAIAPRGIVAAAVSSVFSLRLLQQGEGEARLLMPTTFLVIAGCVVIYGSLARPLVRLLGLGEQPRRGVLFLGAHRPARVLAEALMKADVPVFLVDTDRRRVMRCRAMGLPAEHGRLLSEYVLNRLDLGKIGQLIALTASDDANTLAVSHFKNLLGPENVHQIALTDGGSQHTNSPKVRGGEFAPDTDYDQLMHFSREGQAKTTPITDEFDFDSFLQHYGRRVLPLLAIDKDGVPRVLTPHGKKPGSGELVVSLLLKERASPPVSRPHVTGHTSFGAI